MPLQKEMSLKLLYSGEYLYNELQGKVKELYKIGDAKNPHNMGNANRDGHFVGRFL